VNDQIDLISGPGTTVGGGELCHRCRSGVIQRHGRLLIRRGGRPSAALCAVHRDFSEQTGSPRYFNGLIIACWTRLCFPEPQAVYPLCGLSTLLLLYYSALESKGAKRRNGDGFFDCDWSGSLRNG